MNKQYREIEFRLGDTLADAVNKLLELKTKEILASGEFNGVVLYSDTVTIDSAYEEVIGVSKEEFDERQKDRQEEYEREKKEHEETIPELAELWMKKGREVLKQDKWLDWDRTVPVRLHDLYRGMELGNCLDIVKILNNHGTLKEAKEEIENQDHSGMSFGLVCSMVEKFCDRGKVFVDYVK